MADIALRANAINKYFHDPVTMPVLKNITFDVQKGEFVSIVGKSGCGKSTLLYVLSTMDRDYEGTLELNGGKKAIVTVASPGWAGATPCSSTVRAWKPCSAAMARPFIARSRPRCRAASWTA